MSNYNDLPPGNFNLIDNAFQPTKKDNYEHIKGLTEKVSDLTSKGRLRSALDEIFKVLDQHPDHPQALHLAMVVMGRDQDDMRRAAEPISDIYYNDRRLDPIFTVCSRCKRANWISRNALFGDVHSMTIFDPAGLQCYNCGYVMCRHCLREVYGNDYLSDTATLACHNCGKTALRIPVYPTGRTPQQMKRHKRPVICVILFRHGPLPPDETFIKNILALRSPEVNTDNIPLFGVAFRDWPGNMYMQCQLTLLRMEGKGELPRGSSDYAEMFTWQEPGYGHLCILKVVQPPPES
jgi:hypothetical protein